MVSQGRYILFIEIIFVFLGNSLVRSVITDLRLVGGPTSNKGTVEIRIDNGTWETTCGVNLGIFDVIVICRQLGFAGVSRRISVTPYGHHSTPIRGLGCNGGKYFFY
ncbi:CD5 antigen-like [Strongylocentrotus purpuratus]|uniref:SRCR domain-containing protein n=1 Tax=Strongylocentrotus purpuratus TaxID=7668 RepID=A0A7M7NFG9_STRPU|nr:CD5 antigen-like [Strongylocentrotus purpuratus]